MGKKMVGAFAMLGCGCLTLGVGQSDVAVAKSVLPENTGSSSLSIMDFRGALSMPKEQRPFSATAPLSSIDEESEKKNAKNEVDEILKGLLGPEALAAPLSEAEEHKEAEKKSDADENEAGTAVASLDVYGYQSIGLANVHTYLNVRNGASMSAGIIGKMQPDSACEILGYEGEWAKIRSGAVCGYAHSAYLLTGEEAKKRADYLVEHPVTVDASALRIRKEADIGSDVVTLVGSGTRLALAEDSSHSSNAGTAFLNFKVVKGADSHGGIDSLPPGVLENEWVQVRLDENVEGYVRTDYVRLSSGLKTAESTVIDEIDAEPDVQADEDLGAEDISSPQEPEADSLDLSESGEEEPEADTETVADTKSEEDSEIKTDTGTEEDSEIKTDTGSEKELEIEEDSGTEEDSEIKADTESEEELEIKADTGSEKDPENKAKADSEEDSENKVEADSEKDSEIKTETVPEDETEIKTDAEPEADQENETESNNSDDSDVEADLKPEDDVADTGFHEAKSGLLKDSRQEQSRTASSDKTEKITEKTLSDIHKSKEEKKDKKEKQDIASAKEEQDEDSGSSSGRGKAKNSSFHYDYTESERMLLAGIIQAEAGNQPYEGKMAVASVVMNRVESSGFPDTISGVIYSPNQFTPAGTGQLASILASGPSQECIEAATEVLNDSRNVPNLYFKSAYYARSHGIAGRQIGDQVFH